MANWTKLREKEGLVRQKKREEEGTLKDETERSVMQWWSTKSKRSTF